MNQPPLNPDALDMRAYDEALLAFKKVSDLYPVQAVALKDACIAYAAHLAAALPEVTSVEELEALPVGTVILSESYRYSLTAPNYPVVFQKLYTKEWHRGGRVAETLTDMILPARVLYLPEVKA